jgi:hypothetical protein
MRFTRRLLLGAVPAVVALALSASSALAITVSSEGTGVACPKLTASGGGCVLHVNGEVQMQDHVFGVESVSGDCVVEMTGRVESSGAAVVDTAAFSHHGGASDCTRSSCDLPWTTTLSTSGSAINLTSTFCAVAAGGSKQSCTVSLLVAESGHQYSSSFHVGASAHVNAPGCEAEGQFALESGGIEIS